MQPPTLTPLQSRRQRLLEMRERQLRRFTAAATERKTHRMRRLCAGIAQTNDFLNSLDEIERDLAPPDGQRRSRYVVSSLFLYESFKKLTADREEQFFFVTGSEVNGVLILDQWAEFTHQKRSVVGVTGDTRATHRALLKLEQFRHRLLAHFHSHPGNGPGSTQPSGIDEGFQGRLESAGHLAVMAIFSRDGFVRFVRLDGIPEIEIYGSGVEKHDHEKSIYRLTDINQA